jgi:hypothetical protein
MTTPTRNELAERMGKVLLDSVINIGLHMAGKAVTRLHITISQILHHKIPASFIGEAL